MDRAAIVSATRRTLATGMAVAGLALIAACGGQTAAADLTPAQAAELLRSSDKLNDQPAVRPFGDVALQEVTNVTPEGSDRARASFTWKFVQQFDRSANVPTTLYYTKMLSTTLERTGEATFVRSNGTWQVDTVGPLSMEAEAWESPTGAQ